MTGAVIIVGLVLLVAAAFGWARLSAARAERHSIDSYGRALGALGDVARRNDNAPGVRVTPTESAGVGRVRAGGSKSQFGPASTAASKQAVRLEERPADRIGDRPVRRTLPSGARLVPARLTASESVSVPRIALPAPLHPLRFEDDALFAAEDLLEEHVLRTDRRARPADRGSTARRARSRDGRPTGPAARTHRRPTARKRSSAAREVQDRPPTPRRRSAGRASPLEDAPRRRSAGRASPLDAGHRQATLRRVATGTAAGVAVLFATVGVLQLTGSSRQPPRRHDRRPPATTTHRASIAPAPAPAPSVSAGAGGASDAALPAATRLVPTSTTPSDVAFKAPSRTYLLTFSDSGTSDCWVGIGAAAGGGSSGTGSASGSGASAGGGASPGSGAWLWTETLAPGTTTSYRARGPVVVDLGAPKNIELRVNGLQAELPGYAVSYDVSFTKPSAA